MVVIRRSVRFIFLVIFLMGLLWGTACVQQEKAARLDQIDSLNRLESLASAGIIRLEDPGNGFKNIIFAVNRNKLTVDKEPVFDVVIKGELGKAKETLIKNNYIDDFTLLLLKGNRFRVKRASGTSAPQVLITMSGKGTASGVRAELMPIAKPPYTIARLLFSTGALPDFNLATTGKGLYVQAEYQAAAGSAENADAAAYNVPLQRLLKLLFEIEYPQGRPGSIAGTVFLLHYKVKQIQAQSILFDCLYYVEIE
jgi:hypothetical protein